MHFPEIICTFEQTQQISVSLLRFSPRDRPNGTDRGRRLLLVHGRIRRRRTSQGFKFLPDRQSDDRCIYLADCPGILLLPHLDIEQAGTVDMSVDCRRTYPFFHFHRIQLALFVIFFHEARHSASSWGSVGRYPGEYLPIRIPSLYLTRNSVSYTWNLFSCKAGSICTHPLTLHR